MACSAHGSIRRECKLLCWSETRHEPRQIEHDTFSLHNTCRQDAMRRSLRPTRLHLAFTASVSPSYNDLLFAQQWLTNGHAYFDRSCNGLACDMDHTASRSIPPSPPEHTSENDRATYAKGRTDSNDLRSEHVAVVRSQTFSLYVPGGVSHDKSSNSSLHFSSSIHLHSI